MAESSTSLTGRDRLFTVHFGHAETRCPPHPPLPLRHSPAITISHTRPLNLVSVDHCNMARRSAIADSWNLKVVKTGLRQSVKSSPLLLLRSKPNLSNFFSLKYSLGLSASPYICILLSFRDVFLSCCSTFPLITCTRWHQSPNRWHRLNLALPESKQALPRAVQREGRRGEGQHLNRRKENTGAAASDPTPAVVFFSSSRTTTNRSVTAAARGQKRRHIVTRRPRSVFRRR